MNTDIHRQLIEKLASLKIKNLNRLNKTKRKFANNYKIGMIRNADLLALYKTLLKTGEIKRNEALENLLQKRKIRTLSGVAPVAVLTKPYKCPGKCAYCPTEKDMPKSYLSNEPAVMRAIANKFDPFTQVSNRILTLENNGHDTDKIELIIMGGTWSYFPKRYQNWFVKRCFDACNEKKAPTLAQAHTWNETAKHRIVALTLETRPDYIDEQEVINWRKLGATKVELGVQAIDDAILKLNKRGHGVKEIIRATRLFKQAGFKVAYHIMPNLPGSTPTKDLAMFKQLFSNPDYQPDFIKIYPTIVTAKSLLYKWWKQGKYKPYSPKQLIKLLVAMKKAIPDRVRLIRLIRDIPKESIVAGNIVTNLRETINKEMHAQNERCVCIRCREAREDIKNLKQAKLFIENYEASPAVDAQHHFRASGATEYFLQYASPDKRKLYAFLRLRLPQKDEPTFIPEITNCAMIREVHTYGRLIPLKLNNVSGIQHAGFGTKLTKLAEKIARDNEFTKMAVISGVGVRGFYRKLGYRLSGTYMVKRLG